MAFAAHGSLPVVGVSALRSSAFASVPRLRHRCPSPRQTPSQEAPSQIQPLLCRRPTGAGHDHRRGAARASATEDSSAEKLQCGRRLILSLPLPSILCSVLAPLPASANPIAILGDPTVTVADVTPSIVPATPLSPSEEAVAQLFAETTYSVVNIFDSTLRPAANTTGAVEVPEGNGSGFVWDSQGHIVTNYHVIASALSQKPRPGTVVARVSLLGTDGLQRNYQAGLVGADRSKDLAVLQINAEPELLRPLPVGDSAALRVGQRCYAIGNPFGFDHTLTAGIVSGLNRDILSANRVVIGGGVQTDAAINPGNSGGPLLNIQGSLIGVNTAIYTNTGTSAGVGFAIPTSAVARVVPQLIAFGKVVRPSLGLQLAPDNVAKQLGVRTGALILAVTQGSPAERVGLTATRRGLAGNIVLGDVILRIKDAKVKSSTDAERILDDCAVGEEVALQVLRGEEERTIQVVLGEGPQ